MLNLYSLEKFGKIYSQSYIWILFPKQNLSASTYWTIFEKLHYGPQYYVFLPFLIMFDRKLSGFSHTEK